MKCSDKGRGSEGQRSGAKCIWPSHVIKGSHSCSVRSSSWKHFNHQEILGRASTATSAAAYFSFFPLRCYLICQQQYISALLSPKLFTPTGGEAPQTFSRTSVLSCKTLENSPFQTHSNYILLQSSADPLCQDKKETQKPRSAFWLAARSGS